MLNGERRPYSIALPVKLVGREAIEERAAAETRTLSGYATRVGGRWLGAESARPNRRTPFALEAFPLPSRVRLAPWR